MQLALKDKTAGTWNTKKELLDRISLILNQPVTLVNIGELDDALLDLVERDIEQPATF